MRRLIERVGEKLLVLGYREDNHAAHYRRVMEWRALLRRISGVPLTNSVDEGQPVAQQLIKLAGIAPDSHVLDFGCGAAGVGYHLAEATQNGRYLGVDVSPSAVQAARETLKPFPHATVRRIERPEDVASDGPFDFVVSQSVFTHNPLSVFRSFLKAMAPLLKPEGAIVANFGVHESASELLKSDFIFSEAQIIAAAEDCSMKIERATDWVHPAQAKRPEGAAEDRLYIVTNRA